MTKTFQAVYENGVLRPTETVDLPERCTVEVQVREVKEEPRPLPGRAKGMLTIHSEDDEHLKDFAEYMP